MPTDEAPPLGIATLAVPARFAPFGLLVGRLRRGLGWPRRPKRQRRLAVRRAIGYGLAFCFVAAAAATTLVLEAVTGKFLSFPFYAAVVASVWFGTGPGCLSLLLAIVAVEDYWTPPLFSLRIAPDEVPAFLAFVACAMMSFAWSWQRRRAENALEVTVQQRTADLLHTNAALQAEIIERQAAEEELRRSETLLAQGQKLSRTASWTLRLPSGAMQWSGQLFDLLGLDHAEAPSYRLFVDHMHPDDRPLFEQAIERAMGELGDFSCEARIVVPDGPTRHVHAVAEVKRGADDGIELIGTIMDLTERKRTEQALRDTEAELGRTLRLATLAELAGAIAHEINQPLAAITANGSACLRSLSREPPLLDNARDAAGCIVADGHRAGDVIARIRALFNREAPKQQRLDLNELLQRVLDLSRGAIDRQRILVRRDLTTPGPAVVGDPVQLQQVLFNLVTNAIEAMTGVTGRRRILTIRSGIEEGKAVVRVEDSGEGLSSEQTPRIFESFYSTKKNGIGLGLAISRSIIDAHGGTLWAAGKQHGATFGFSLPLAAALAAPPSGRGVPATPRA